MDTLTRRAGAGIPSRMDGEQTIELFCGERMAFSQIARALGYATFTVDKDAAHTPDLVADVSALDASRLPQRPLILWAAPPSSPAFFDEGAWEGDGSLYPKTTEAEDAMELVRHTIRLIFEIRPTWWFIEHPKSLLRGMPAFAGFNRGYPTRNRQTIRHDEYGGASAAETDVWTNAHWWIPRPGPCDGEGGADTGRRVPPSVFAEIFEQLDVYRVTGSYGPR
jgi:hypothetical protein